MSWALFGRAAGVVAALVLSSGIAAALDKPTKQVQIDARIAPVNPWDLSIGLNAGFAFTRNDYEDFPQFQSNGAGAGGHVAVKYRMGGWFIGGEFGGMALNVHGTNPDGAFVDYNWQTWQMGLVGVALPPAQANNVFLYAGFGAAQGGVRAGIDTSFIQESMSKTLYGYTARVGVEGWVTPTISVGAAYQYSRFTGNLDLDPIGTRIHMLQLTVDYHLTPQSMVELHLTPR
jgi:opacity protein-like surface antigen